MQRERQPAASDGRMLRQPEQLLHADVQRGCARAVVADGMAIAGRGLEMGRRLRIEPLSERPADERVERGLKTIHVVNRTYEKAVAFRDRFGASVQPARWEDVPDLLDGAQLLANSTSLGMSGQPELDIDLAPMAKDAIVADIIYIPLKTKLLAAAEQRGLKTSNGLDMLLYQAVRGFQLWFGVKPEVTPELRDLLVADILKK